MLVTPHKQLTSNSPCLLRVPSVPCRHYCGCGHPNSVPNTSQWLALHFPRGNMPCATEQPAEESLFISFAPFLPMFFPFSPVRFEHSLYSPGNSLLLGMWLANISSHSVTGGLSIHLPRSFAEQKVLTSDEEQVMTSSLLCMFLVSNPGTLYLALDSKDLSLFFFLKSHSLRSYN